MNASASCGSALGIVPQAWCREEHFHSGLVSCAGLSYCSFFQTFEYYGGLCALVCCINLPFARVQMDFMGTIIGCASW